MKKLLLLVLILLSVVLGYTLSEDRLFEKETKQQGVNVSKKPILRIGLVADSHNENEMLGDALAQAQGMGVNFVIGLGDYTNLGTIKELEDSKAVFDESGFSYYVIPGDRDGWESRNRGGVDNFEQVFYPDCHSRESGTLENWIPHQVRDDKNCTTQVFTEKEIQFILLDNSNIYKGISDVDWKLLESIDDNSHKLTFVFAHKTPFHPESKHIMGEDSEEVSRQARKLIDLMEGRPASAEASAGKVDGFFSGDLHFFAKYLSPAGSVKITTVGAVASERNFQGPRFAILTVYEDYSWEVEDVEIR